MIATLPLLTSYIDLRGLLNEEAERLHRLDPTLPRSVIDEPKKCITCHGKGTFVWWSHAAAEAQYADLSPPEPIEYECNCIQQWKLHRFFLAGGIGTAYQRLGWRDATGVEQEGIDAVSSYYDHADAFVDAGCGMILHGPVGNGKTLLAILLLKTLLAHGYDGYFTTFSGLLETFMAGWRDMEEKAWFYSRIKQAGVLVIDDVGRERKQNRPAEEHKGYSTSVAETTFEEIIRHRLSMARPTIVTTNLDPEGLKKGYGANVISLLHERSRIVGMKAEDFRTQARLRLGDEILQGLTRPLVVG